MSGSPVSPPPAGSRPLGILVCVKPVNRQAAKLAADKGDRVALEAALRLKEQIRSRAGVSVLLMGPPAAESVARQCLAAGADEAWLLTDRALAGSDAQATARALAAAIRYLDGRAARDSHPAPVGPAVPADLVLTGVASSDGGTGQVGPAVATLLGIGLVAGAGGRELEALAAGAGSPALVTVARTACAPRPSTMLGIVQARSRPLRLLDCATIGLDPATVGENGSATRVSRLVPLEAGSRAKMIGGGPPDQARALVELLRAGRGGGSGG